MQATRPRAREEGWFAAALTTTTPVLASSGHAGTVVGILAAGTSANPFTASADSTDAMAVDETAGTSSSSTGAGAAAAPSSSSSTAPEKSEATKKKEAEAKAEREKKYPPPYRSGIVLAAEKKVTSKLLEKEKGSSEKLFLVNGCALTALHGLARMNLELIAPSVDACRNVLTGVAGYNADANSLVSYARNAAQVTLYLL
jgi:20S proteasome subunit alpha 3